MSDSHGKPPFELRLPRRCRPYWDGSGVPFCYADDDSPDCPSFRGEDECPEEGHCALMDCAPWSHCQPAAKAMAVELKRLQGGHRRG